jgi:tetratricopeptide (TPR) repeat protein
MQAWWKAQDLPQARKYSQYGQWELAALIYQRLASEEPNRAELFAEWGLCLVRQGKHAEAEAVLKRALEIDERQGGVQTYLGVCLQNRGQLQDALACYQRAVERDPPSAETFFYLGDTLENLKRFREAAEAYQRASDVMPSLSLAQKRRDWCLTRAQ